MLAYAWMLERDKERFRDARKRADVLPLGSAALAGTSIPILFFSLFAGVFADRVDKRAILIAAQAVMFAQALVLAILTHLGLINIGWIIVNARRVLPLIFVYALDQFRRAQSPAALPSPPRDESAWAHRPTTRTGPRRA